MKNGRNGILYVVATTMFFSNQVFATPSLKELCDQKLISQNDCALVGGAAATAAGATTAYKANSTIQQVRADETHRETTQANILREANEAKLRSFLNQHATDGASETDMIPESRRAPHMPGTNHFEEAYGTLSNNSEAYKLDVILKGEMAQQEAARIALADATKMDLEISSERAEVKLATDASPQLENRRQFLTNVSEAMEKHLSSTKNGSAAVNTADLIGSVRAQMTSLESILARGDHLTPEQQTQLNELKVLRDYLKAMPRGTENEAGLKQKVRNELAVANRAVEANEHLISENQENIDKLSKQIVEKKDLAAKYASGELRTDEHLRTSYYKIGDRLFQVVDKDGTLVEVDGKTAAYIEKLKASGSTPLALKRFNSKNSRSLAASRNFRTGGMIIGAIGLSVVIHQLTMGSLDSEPSAPVTKVQPATPESARVGSTN